MSTSRSRMLGAALAAALAVTGIGGATAAGAAVVKQYEGTVVSVDRDTRSFKLRDTERGTVRIKVKSSTRFERIAGFGALKAGMKRIEATVRRTDAGWVAREVERSGGGGRHGGDDDGGDHRGGDDDGPGHDVGDDKGGER